MISFALNKFKHSRMIQSIVLATFLVILATISLVHAKISKSDSFVAHLQEESFANVALHGMSTDLADLPFLGRHLTLKKKKKNRNNKKNKDQRKIKNKNKMVGENKDKPKMKKDKKPKKKAPAPSITVPLGPQRYAMRGLKNLPLPTYRLYQAPWNFNKVINNMRVTQHGSWNKYTFPGNPGRCAPDVAGVSGGLMARGNPHNMFPSNSIQLQAKVHFPPNFMFGPVTKPTECGDYWQRGGKFLLGVKIGDAHTGGGVWSPDSGSVRLMWMSDWDAPYPSFGPKSGILIAYVYLPTEVLPMVETYRRWGAMYPEFKAPWMDDEFLRITWASGTGGYTLWRRIPDAGRLDLQAGGTYKIGLSVTLNTPGKADGVLSIHVDDQKLEHSGIMFTKSNAKLTGIAMDHWYGGGNNNYVPYGNDLHFLASEFKIGY